MFKELLKKWKDQRLTRSMLRSIGVDGIFCLKDFADWLDLHVVEQGMVCIDTTRDNSDDSWWVWICACDVMNHKSERICPSCGRHRPAY